MSDGRITGRLIREHVHHHNNGKTATLYLTLVKARGNAASDFLTLEYFVDESQAAKNKVKLLQKLASESTLVEVTYNLKSRSYKDNSGTNVYKEYIQLQEFEILESKQAVKDRLSHSDEGNIEEKAKEIKEETHNPTNSSFDPEASGSFIEDVVGENLKDSKPKSTDNGKYGNPFE